MNGLKPRRWRGTMALVLLLACGLVLGGWMHDRLSARRAVLARAAALPPAGALPPWMTLTKVMLGGFRGVVADVLWFRASRLQSEGRYVELVALADWITRLDPHSPAIWIYQAGNLAFNVSAMMADPAERWRWVRHGLVLLRDEARRYVPDDPRVYFEIGLLFQYKLGTPLDRAHAFYQQRWAEEMQALFGGAGATPGRWVDPGFREALRTAYGMEAAQVAAIDARYGPLDWRLPETHALYWAAAGLERAPGGVDFRCERMIYQALAVSFFMGRLERDGPQGRFERGPRTDLLPKVLAAYDAARGRHAWPQVAASYQRFLEDALPLLEETGQEHAVDAVRQRLREAAGEQ